MRGNIIIRIRRKNEFNGYWAFLLASAILFAILSFKIKTTTEAIITTLAFATILTMGTLYQGFEVIKE